MKDFKKTNNDLFICMECNQLFTKKDKLSYHINKKHNGVKDYYDKWVKDVGEGLCKICEKETEFLGFKYFYKNCCSKNCQKIYRRNQTNLSNLKIYGFENASENEEIKNKIKKTWDKKSKDEKHIIRQKIEENWVKNYGVSNNMLIEGVKQKLKDTNIKKYGVDNPSKNEKIKKAKKIKLQTTLLNKYGVKNVSQISEFFEKSQKKQFKLQKFKNTDIIYQGSYELDFLEKYFDKYPDIKRGPTIKYMFDGEFHYYHSDFFIPSLNLVIEIKNNNLFNKDFNKIKQKEIFTIKEGYNYIIIIDKNYTNLNL